MAASQSLAFAAIRFVHIYPKPAESKTAFLVYCRTYIPEIARFMSRAGRTDARQRERSIGVRARHDEFCGLGL